jgi:hypothetical protein
VSFFMKLSSIVLCAISLLLPLKKAWDVLATKILPFFVQKDETEIIHKTETSFFLFVKAPYESSQGQNV